MILKRIEEDRGDSTPDVITGIKVKSHLLDWKIWAFGEYEKELFGVTISHDTFSRINVFLCDGSRVGKWVRQNLPEQKLYFSTSCRFFITIILTSMGWNIRDSMLLVSTSERLHVVDSRYSKSAPPFIVAVGDLTLSCGTCHLNATIGDE